VAIDLPARSGERAPARAGATAGPTVARAAVVLALLPEDSRWHGAEVVNRGVPGTTTLDWVERLPEKLCAGGKRAQSPRVLAVACERRSPLADAVRRHLLERGIMNGPDWPPLPTVDGLHLTEGGYAAAAGLWLDVLRKQAP
jgi:hypothetical protein